MIYGCYQSTIVLDGIVGRRPACPASGGQPVEHNSTGADLMRIAIAKQLPDDDKKWLNIDDNE